MLVVAKNFEGKRTDFQGIFVKCSPIEGPEGNHVCGIGIPDEFYGQVRYFRSSSLESIPQG